MSTEPTSVEDAFEEYLDLRRRGEAIEAKSFAARFPHVQDELELVLDSFERLHGVIGPGSDAAPERVGPYRIVREIGRGGMGVVLEAVEEPLGRRVALKMLPAENLSSPVARARLRREAQIAARLDHSGIATIYGAGVEADPPWIAMRYVEGDTLSHAIAAARAQGAACVRPVPAGDAHVDAPRWIARTLARVARALQFAHEQGVLHRDVKPSNVILAHDGTPVLLDFGLAVGDAADGATLTRTGQTAGTPAYMAPELVSGELARHDAGCDVYALGVTLYECLTLQRPFEGPTQVALYRAITSGAASDVRSRNRDVSRDLAIVVATAMERDPARRYRSAALLAADLEACAEGRPILARAVPLHGRVQRWARREPRQATLVALLLVALFGLAVFVGQWWSSRGTVLAAERAARERSFEEYLRRGFSGLATPGAVGADREFLAALELDPASVEARIGRALTRIEVNRFAEARELLEGIPSSPALEALREFLAGRSPALELGPAWFARASAFELFLDGLRLSKQGQRLPESDRRPVFVLAASRFEEAVNRAPHARATYHMLRVSACRVAGDEAGVRSTAAAIATLWPDSSRALSTAGNALQLIDPDAASELVLRAIELDPTWNSPHQVLGNIHFYRQRYPEAVAASRAALLRDPTDASAHNTLGVSLMKLGCADEARPELLAALSLTPNTVDAWINLSDLEVARKNLAGRELCLRMILAAQPATAFAHGRLAKLLYERRDAAGAFDHAVAAVALEPNSAWNWQVLAVVAGGLGHVHDALWIARKAVELEPKNADYPRLVAILEAQVEKADRAHAGLPQAREDQRAADSPGPR